MATTVRKGSDRPGAKKAIRKTAGAAAAKKAGGKTAKTAQKKAARKAPLKKAAAKQTPAKQAVAKKAVAKKAVAKKAVAKKTVARKAPRKAAPKRAARGITPAQALANTRRLLEEKQAHDRESPPWQALDGRHAHEPHAGGFQDAQARDRANELHAGESHLEAIQGAVGTRDRHNQGKRDQR